MIFKSFLARLFQFMALGLFVVASPAVAEKARKLTPMELQAIQSREFEVSKEVSFGAVMTVIQDLGYTVETADVISGFITAASPTENKTNFFEAFGGVSASGNTVMTVFLMKMPNGMTRIRLNFVNSKSTSSAYGRGSRQDKPILEPAVYNNAWERIDEALFVMGALSDTSEKNTPLPSVKAVTAPQVSSDADESSGLPKDEGILAGVPDSDGKQSSPERGLR